MWSLSSEGLERLQLSYLRKAIIWPVFLTHCVVNTDIRFNFISLNSFNLFSADPKLLRHCSVNQIHNTNFVFRKKLPLWWVNVKHRISSRKGLHMLLRMRHSLTYQKCQHFPKIRKKSVVGMRGFLTEKQALSARKCHFWWQFSEMIILSFFQIPF